MYSAWAYLRAAAAAAAAAASGKGVGDHRANPAAEAAVEATAALPHAEREGPTQVLAVRVARRDVPAQAELKSKISKQYLVFWFRALSYRRFQHGLHRFNLHHPTVTWPLMDAWPM